MKRDDTTLLPNRAGDQARRTGRLFDRAEAAENECVRLRGLLAIARGGIAIAFNALPRSDEFSDARRASEDALRRSDPDVQPEDEDTEARK